MWIERLHTNKLEEAVKNRPVVLLTGLRQAGKSSLLIKLFPDAEYVTLDKVVYAQEAEENPSKFLDRFKNQVIIDEIQYAPSLFRELKVRVDENRDTKGKWILTGSQQFALMEKVSESLAGRVRIIQMGTLSAKELNSSGLLVNKNDLLWKGGFPEIWAQDLNPQDYYEDYIQTYIERDLKQMINVNNLRDFRKFVSLLALRAGQLLNYSELAKDVGVAVNTIKAWVAVLETSGIVLLLPPYYNNLGKRLIKSPKVYFCDNGLLTSLVKINSWSALEKSPYIGNIWENFVLTELSKYNFQPGKNTFYYRDQNGVEIDFILEKDGVTYLIEAKHSERVNPQKLNFAKVEPLFKSQTKCVLACNITEKGMFDLKDYSVYNPLFGCDFSFNL
ncbi:MAG TPA: ATP-binding protein [Prolixibacteraceae bacterium]|nr:ATP-binding protein [Prolixibacteraceae bacterium]HPR59683.1 ATP-binding protein [Prolixibacteraceae bacterium]